MRSFARANPAGTLPANLLRRPTSGRSGRRLTPALSQLGEAHEIEADRIAGIVMRPRADAPRDGSTDPSRNSATARSVTDRPLESEDRRFFESRFNHSFADVRVHADREAGESAQALNARAFTTGGAIAFAPGEYRPGTHAGRQLIAHELAHVVQQRTHAGPLPIVQRKPKDPATRPAPKPQTLKSEGVDVTDPVHSTTARVIDTVLLRNKTLAPYIGARLKGGFRIAEKGKFVQEVSDGNFDNEYRKAYNLNSGDHVSADILGFLDTGKSVIHVRPGATFGVALHESIHRLASPQMYNSFVPNAAKVSSDLAEVLKEGVTSYFTDLVLNDEGLTRHIDKYAKSRQKAENLIAALGKNGFDLIAKFNFQGQGIVEIGNALGLSTQQYIALKGQAIAEVFKRMAAAL